MANPNYRQTRGRGGARVDISRTLKTFEEMSRGVRQANEDLQIELATAGEEKMKELIETGGTGNRWSKPYRAKYNPARGDLRAGSFPGRVNTGNMRDSVGRRFERGQTKTFAAFGWIRNREDYFLFQEYGYTHAQAGVEVKGMFALRDARRYVVRQVLPRLIRKYGKRIARGVY